MEIYTLKDIKELKGKKVLLRVDFNVPINNKGEIEDDTRMTESLPTIKHLIENCAKTIILTHLGRPDGKSVDSLKLTEMAKHLSKLIDKKVTKSPEVIGSKTTKLVNEMKDGEIVMLENVRFEEGEEKCDEHLTKKLSKLGDLFINDAFGTAHRDNASTCGIARHMPSYGGFLMEKEIKELSKVKNATHPITMIFGGAKIDTKIGIIEHFIHKADYFLMGGGIANTFLSAAGYNVGNSLFESDKKAIAQKIMLECEKENEKFVLPTDVIVASEIGEKVETLNISVENVIGDMKILDIGTHTIEKFTEIIKKSATVIWNGPLGLYEYEIFRNGTNAIAEAIANSNCKSILGGGDTADAIEKSGISKDKFTHISTGGGAAIEFLSGKTLPAVECLLKK